jgi:predicted PurR-regulated permease PerM
MARPAERVVLAAALLAAAWLARDVLLLSFAGILLAILIRTPAAWLAGRLGGPAALWVAAVGLGSLTIVGGAFWLQGDAIGVQVQELRERLPATLERLEADVRGRAWGRLLLDRVPDAEDLVPDTGGVVERATGVLASTLAVLTNVALVLFLGLVLAFSPGPYVRGLLRLVPPARRARAAAILEQLASVLRWWLLGRLLSMGTIGLLTLLGLALLGVPLALALALIAALLSFIPNIGPISSAVPAVLLGFMEGVRKALLVTGLYLGVQFVESWVLDPVIDRKMVYLPPGLVVVAQVGMYLVGGLLGVALATPLVAAAVVLVRTLYVEDVLGDREAATRA